MSEKSFHEILREKLAKSSPLSPPQKIVNASSTRPFATEVEIPLWLDFNVKKFTGSSTAQILDVYPVARKIFAKPKPKTEAPTKPESYIFTNKLNSDANLALKILNVELSEGRVSLRICKQAYRRKMQVLHPDRHPENLSTEAKERLTREFQSVHEAFQIVDQAFKAQSTKTNAA